MVIERGTGMLIQNHDPLHVAATRSQAEKSNSSIDRLALGENQAERSWSSYRHDFAPSYQLQNGPVRSPNVAYGMYPLPAMNSSGVPSKVLMDICSTFVDALNEGSRAWVFEEYRFYRGSGLWSSPDRPSSPHHPR
ncbi:unnamed protein product [Fraxinus pennsylvanica]|uniref:Uncharacterized protein n=1 Tax=Fraxinus pennsylvanica TaxID=56036 RepID=A0AAD2DUV6_9LAMI|nr:unnamed protein product [Fraxinus pennsylvanica]